MKLCDARNVLRRDIEKIEAPLGADRSPDKEDPTAQTVAPF
jgi:hypothetical protein